MFSLPKLKYPYDAFEKSIDSLTMEIHYNKHHGTYVNNLNLALESFNELKDKTIEELISNINNLPEQIRLAIRNNGGGHWNHSFFWDILSPVPKNPSESFLQILNKHFGGLDQFKEQFKASCLRLFGSGWCWLIKDVNGSVFIANTPNQDNPLMDVATVKGKPILGLDLWEHAYYLRYQNKRGDYVDNFWNIVDWDKVDELYNAK